MKLDLKLGRKAVRRRCIDAEHVRMYRDITGNANPLHFDEAYARAIIFGRLIVRGGITAGALDALVAERMAGPGSVFIKQELEYVGPAYVGDELSAHGEVVWLHDSKPVCRLEVRVTARGPGDAAKRLCVKGQCVVYRAMPG